MPELPEVETIVRDINKTVKGETITGVWFDWKKIIRELNPEQFEKQIKGRKILGARRRAKYILIDLSGGKTLVIHQKISGHMLYGKWVRQEQKSKSKDQNDISKSKDNQKQEWVAEEDGPLKKDPQNRFIRFILFLKNGKMLALSDLRRFAKVLLLDTNTVNTHKDFKTLGPEPLETNFTPAKFTELMRGKKGKIKTVLMDQTVIAGIGNIYSDEILWHAGIHPLQQTATLSDEELARIYRTIKKVLSIGIKEHGDSQQDYRRLNGTLGHYQEIQKAYRMTNKSCLKKDGGIIKRLKIGGRSAHFCPVHQK